MTKKVPLFALGYTTSKQKVLIFKLDDKLYKYTKGAYNTFTNNLKDDFEFSVWRNTLYNKHEIYITMPKEYINE